jgi:hypothetical protein
MPSGPYRAPVALNASGLPAAGSIDSAERSAYLQALNAAKVEDADFDYYAASRGGASSPVDAARRTWGGFSSDEKQMVLFGALALVLVVIAVNR